MSAVLDRRSHAGTLRPVDLPRLRAVSARAPIDVPALTVTRPERVALQAVPDMGPEHDRDLGGVGRLVGVLKFGIIASASAAFAFGLELWLTF